MTEQTEIKGEDIKRLRERTNMSQKDLAALLGVDPTTVLRWEQGNGSAKPTGTAAVVLKASIAGLVGAASVTGLGLIAPLVPALGVYMLLKQVFKGIEDRLPADERDPKVIQSLSVETQPQNQ